MTLVHFDEAMIHLMQYSSRRLLKEFSNKKWTRGDLVTCCKNWQCWLD